MAMATHSERDTKVDEMHARLTEARVAIMQAIACNSRAPCLAGGQNAYRAMAEAERLLNNVVACLPWGKSTAA